MTVDSRPTLADPDDDPWLWLEAVEDERALVWVEAQNRRTLERYAGPAFDAERNALAAILDRPDNIPHVARRGPWLYNFWTDAGRPRGLWRRATLADYRREAPDWQPLLDLDALAGAEGEDWIWAGAATLPGSHDRALLRLSRGGGDAVVLREFDLEARCFVEGGFRLPEAKGGAEWLDRDTLLLSSAFGEGRATRAGYARSVRLWRRGEDPADAAVLFETDPGNMAAVGQVDRSARAERVWFIEKPGFFDSVVHLGDRRGPGSRLDLPSDAWIEAHGDWLALKTRAAWSVGGADYGADNVLGIALGAFLDGRRDFTRLWTPHERSALQGLAWCGGRLVLSVLDELAPVFELLTPDAAGWSHTRLPGIPQAAVARVWPLDVEPAESNGDLLALVEDPLTPPALMLAEARDRTIEAPEVLKRAPATFAAPAARVTRHEVRSADGERIPYVQVGPPGESGEAPVHLTGYGGFEIAMLPYYRAGVGKLWLERGGTCVVAGIRGGGEFGTRWHEAGRRQGKRLAHDDFAAVAADLATRGVTRPGRIAAEGGSNGGLLIANMLTRYPDRFGALFCTIPLIDMRRYAKLLAGASWIAEYGDPDLPEDWAFLQEISAYHVADAGRRYPPILIATTRRDDRVHPGHARKMAAKLQALGHEAWFYEPAAGGHGYGKDNRERAAFAALGLGFLRRAIGWETEGVTPAG